MNQSLRCCPQCGSAAVSFSALAGGNASCGSCKWEGGEQGLLTVPASGIESTEQIIGIVNDIRQLMSRDVAPSLLKLLVRWGFLECNPNNIAGTLDRRVFSQYLAVTATAIAEALLKQRYKIAIEKEGAHDHDQN